MAVPDALVSELGEPPTLEVRWVQPGALDGRTTAWFDRFPAMTEFRRDDYLINPDLGELSVKIRAGRALDVKMYRGPLGTLDIPSRARGIMEFWQKWSFPLGAVRPAGESSCWQPIRKVRRLTFFSIRAGRLHVGLEPAASGARCAVELTEVTMLGRNWWTLGFEANGPVESLRETVEATAAHVFEHASAEGFEFTLKESGSYSSWIRDQLD